MAVTEALPGNCQEMSTSGESWIEYYEQALLNIKVGRAYHARCQRRYIRTAMLVEKHVALSASSNIAEVGPGLLLPMMRLRWQCECTAYGLLRDSWRGDLSRFGITVVGWNANEPLAGTRHSEQHDLVLFCEVIEHLNRWPIEVLRDICSLLRPGGTLILTTVNFVRLANRIRMVTGRSPLINPFEKTLDGSNHVREYTEMELKRYLAKAGFVNPRSFLWSLYPAGIACAMATLCGALFPSVRNYIAIVADKPVRTQEDWCSEARESTEP